MGKSQFMNYVFGLCRVRHQMELGIPVLSSNLLDAVIDSCYVSSPKVLLDFMLKSNAKFLLLHGTPLQLMMRFRFNFYRK